MSMCVSVRAVRPDVKINADEKGKEILSEKRPEGEGERITTRTHRGAHTQNNAT